MVIIYSRAQTVENFLATGPCLNELEFQAEDISHKPFYGGKFFHAAPHS